MNFKDTKAIYLQIAELICDDILNGQYIEDERIPSVREYAAKVEVNANTCARAYDWLQGQEIIYTKRGLGYFVNRGAKASIASVRRQEFYSESLPQLVKQMSELDISIDQLTEHINRIINSKNITL